MQFAFEITRVSDMSWPRSFLRVRGLSEPMSARIDKRHNSLICGAARFASAFAFAYLRIREVAKPRECPARSRFRTIRIRKPTAHGCTCSLSLRAAT